MASQEGQKLPRLGPNSELDEEQRDLEHKLREDLAERVLGRVPKENNLHAVLTLDHLPHLHGLLHGGVPQRRNSPRYLLRRVLPAGAWLCMRAALELDQGRVGPTDAV